MAHKEKHLALLRQGTHPIWRTYWKLIRVFSPVMNLTGWKDFESWWTYGIAPCLQFVDAIPEGARVVDIGSGQGLPGIVIALLRPDVSVTLVEPRAKRCAFLRMAAQRLKIKVTVEQKNAQNAQGTFDVITARGVADAATLIVWTEHLAHAETRWVLHRPEGVVLEDPRVVFVDYLDLM